MNNTTPNKLSVTGHFQNFSTVGIMSEMPRFVIDLVVATNSFEVEGKSYQFKGFLRGSVSQFHPHSSTKIVMTDQQIDELNISLIDNSVKCESEDFMFNRDEFNQFVKFEWEPHLVSVDGKANTKELTKVRDALAYGFYEQLKTDFEEYLVQIPSLLKTKAIANFDSVVPSV